MRPTRVCQLKKSEPIDEAKAARKSTAEFPQITADINLSPEEIMGRNTWNLWGAGNEHFWNHAAQDIQPVLLCF